MNSLYKHISYFFLVLVVLSIGIRVEVFAPQFEGHSDEITANSAESNHTDSSEQEENPLSLKTAQPQDALVQSILPIPQIQVGAVSALLEWVLPTFVGSDYPSSYKFSTTTFFRTLFRHYISINAP